MKEVLGNANNILADGITKAVRVKLDELTKGIKASVQVPKR